MIFSDLYKSPRSPFSKLRNSHPQEVLVSPDYDADLVSKDKAKSKEAVKRFLAEKIRNDWDFVWPPAEQPVSEPQPQLVEVHLDAETAAQVVPPALASLNGGPQLDEAPGPDALPTPSPELDGVPGDSGAEPDSESDVESEYSVMSEDEAHFRPRADWTSDLSDDDDPIPGASPFRFDSPDSVGTAVQTSILAKKARRRRAVREEVAWNEGLACFEARRNAWTGAKTVRLKPKPPTPPSPVSPRRLFWRHHRTDSSSSNPPVEVMASSIDAAIAAPPLSPTPTRGSMQADMAALSPQTSELYSARSNSSANSKFANSAGNNSQRQSHEDQTLYPVVAILPIPPPLLPPQSPMRASIGPSLYPSLYDKIVAQGMQPSCPINLSDMIRACVVGWKRDGEWPPRPAQMSPAELLAMHGHRRGMGVSAAARLAAGPQLHARKLSTATNASGGGRRMSFGFLGRGEKVADEDPAKDKDKENHPEDDGAKGIRRSLQKVFSLGHGHAGAPNSAVAGNEHTTPLASPTAVPETKEAVAGA